jgi:ubiquinone/menaquinone biosynthesis C-methylase UbiE
LGSGVGANLRYLRPGTRLVAIEPNPHMHSALRRNAERRSIELEISSAVGEKIDLANQSADAVISSLVLCSVSDPSQVVSEIRRILKPGGRFCYVEHVAARKGTPTRVVQRVVRRPWSWVFEGCSCERDLEKVIQSAWFAHVEHHPYRIHSPFLPFNTQVYGVAVA